MTNIPLPHDWMTLEQEIGRLRGENSKLQARQDAHAAVLLLLVERIPACREAIRAIYNSTAGQPHISGEYRVTLQRFLD